MPIGAQMPPGERRHAQTRRGWSRVAMRAFMGVVWLVVYWLPEPTVSES